MLRLLGYLLLCLFGVPYVASAATLYIDPHKTDLALGEAVVAAVRIDVDEESGECINTVDAEFTYPETIEAVDTSTGKSILQLWVERPTIDKEKRTVTFAGGIPNGYCGRIPGDPGLTNVVAEIIFRHTKTTASASTTVAVIESTPRTTVYLNDGFGNPAPLTTYGAEFTLNPAMATDVNDPWSQAIAEDITPPQPFSISLERNEQIFKGQYHITFNTTDKETGIASYEVMEEPLEEQSLFRFGAITAPWQEETSPYVLNDQTLNSTIRVRAIDKAGNQYVATFVPDPSLRTAVWTVGDWLLLAGAGLLVLLLVAGLGWRLARRQRPTRSVPQNTATSIDYKQDPYDTYEDID